MLHNCRSITLALKELETKGVRTNAGLLLIYEGILTPTQPQLRRYGQLQQRSALCNCYPKPGRAIGLRDMLHYILAD